MAIVSPMPSTAQARLCRNRTRIGRDVGCDQENLIFVDRVVEAGGEHGTDGWAAGIDREGLRAAPRCAPRRVARSSRRLTLQVMPPGRECS